MGGKVGGREQTGAGVEVEGGAGRVHDQGHKGPRCVGHNEAGAEVGGGGNVVPVVAQLVGGAELETGDGAAGTREEYAREVGLCAVAAHPG